jgi:hypothetical protein
MKYNSFSQDKYAGKGLIIFAFEPCYSYSSNNLTGKGANFLMKKWFYFKGI